MYLYACQLAETRANEREHPEVDPDKYEYIIAYFVDVRVRQYYFWLWQYYSIDIQKI